MPLILPSKMQQCTLLKCLIGKSLLAGLQKGMIADLWQRLRQQRLAWYLVRYYYEDAPDLVGNYLPIITSYDVEINIIHSQ